MFVMHKDLKRRLENAEETPTQEVWRVYHVTINELTKIGRRSYENQVREVFFQIFNKRGDI